MSTKLFTHSSLGGCGNAVIMGLTKERSLSVEYAEPNTIDSKLVTFISDGKYFQFDQVYITNLVIKEKTAELIDHYNREYQCNFKIFDHHKIADYLNQYDWAWIRTTSGNGGNTCTTELFFHYMLMNDAFAFQDTIEQTREFVELVRLWDTWDWINDPNVIRGLQARDLHILFTINDNKKFVDDMVNRIINNDPIINSYDKSLIDFSSKRKDVYIKNKVKNIQVHELGIDGNKYTVAVTCAEKFVSEIGCMICEKNSHIDIAAIIIPDANRVCLRTTKEIDLSKIAQFYGGGGHEKAAGFIYSGNLFDVIYSNVFGA